MRTIKKLISDFFLDIHNAYENKAMFDAQSKLLSGRNVECIIDAGAFEGVVAFEYRKRFREATIYCFEPFEEAYCVLTENTKDDPLIKPLKLAISNRKAEAEFYSNKYAMTNSLLKTDEMAEHYWARGIFQPRNIVRVSTTTIDDFCTDNDISQIDVLKMDIQGGEMAALAGSQKMMADGRILVIYTEMLLVPTYSGQPQFHEFLGVLKERGFELFKMGNFLHGATGQVRQCDAIFVNRALADSMRKL